MVGDEPNHLILPVLQRLRRAFGDIGELGCQRKTSGACRQQHAVAPLRIRGEWRDLGFVGLTKHQIADAVCPMVTHRLRPSGEIGFRADLFGHDRQRFETARSGDAVAGLLLVGADEQKFLHGGTGLQLAT